jgi:hypothetical protein
MGAGIAHAPASLRPAATPTIPGRESSFARLTPLHAGHEGVRSVVTNISKRLLQSRHRYSYKGIRRFYQPGSDLDFSIDI